MVRPWDFKYNEQTAGDNEFQQRPGIELQDKVHQLVMNEFALMEQSLRREGVKVLVLEKNHTLLETPDAVFPNNWFSTGADGSVLVYPMLAENRNQERRIEDVEQLLVEHDFQIRNLLYIGRPNEPKWILEGTGAMIIDHRRGQVFAARSERCHERQFENFITTRGYEQGFLFDTLGSSGKPIYHTNVMMSIGDGFAVICSECFADKAELKQVLDNLSEDREIIEISISQMEQQFCGNILQIRNEKGEPLIAMSRSAFEGFTSRQKDILEKQGKILAMDVNTIEIIGGGSVRCMMAEIFLPSDSI